MQQVPETPNPSLPPVRHIISVIEERARLEKYERVAFACLPKSTDPRDGFRDVNYQLLKRAIDRMAWVVDDLVGPVSEENKTFGFIGPATDWRYVLLIFAVMKTGHTLFLPSPRNSLEAHLSLLDSCNCNTLLHPKTPAPILRTLTQHRDLRLVALPDLSYFLDAGWNDPEYPFTKPLAEVYHKPCLVLHTSGSTGIPKPILLRHAWFTSVDALRHLPDLGASSWGMTKLSHQRAFVPFPNFHGASITTNTLCAVYLEMTTIHAHPDTPCTASLADLYHVHADVNASFLPVSILKDISKDPSMLQHLETLQVVYYGGSPLSSDIGDIVSRYAHLNSLLGITESGLLPFEETAPEDWEYLHFGPHTGVEFRPVAEEDDRYEMVIVRKPELSPLQVVFTTFPDLEEWPTQDLYSKHPSKPNHWHYEGRADDIIIFNNGEKLNPLSLEQAVQSLPSVKGAIVVGTGQFQSGLLIESFEPVVTPAEKRQFLDRIWPTVAHANQSCVAHGRIDRRMVIFTHPEKPLARSGKGSIQRKASIKLYEPEIAELYARNDEGVDLSTAAPGPSASTSRIRQFLQDFLQETLGQIPSDHEDLFRLGLDSLHVLRLSKELATVAGVTPLDPQTIYKNRSVDKLVAHLAASDLASAASSREDDMTNAFFRFSSGLPFNARLPERSEGMSVFLTGSTGSLGSYILDELLRHPQITKVICANRRPYSRRRQSSLHAQRGLSANLSKAEFVAVDLSQPLLGLPHEKYCDLLQEVTHVLHTAWTMDFNIGFQTFVDIHVTGVRQLIDFCAMSKFGAKLSFASSIGTVQGMQLDSGPEVPEVVFDDWKVSAPTGYAEAKHVCERLLDHASRNSDIAVDILRIGQIAGPVRRGTLGQWNVQEWLPAILKSSPALGQIPQDLGPMDGADWIPVDIMASAIVELLVGSSSLPKTDRLHSNDAQNRARVYHLVNPIARSWSTLLPSVLSRIPSVRPVPFGDWVDSLQRESESGSDVATTERIPASKLLGFFKLWQADAQQSRAFRKLSTTETSCISQVIRDLEPVNSDWMELWLGQWDFAL